MWALLPIWFSAVCSREKEMLPLMMINCPSSYWKSWHCREELRFRSLPDSLNENEEVRMFSQSFSTKFIFLFGDKAFLTHLISRAPVGQHEHRFSNWTRTAVTWSFRSYCYKFSWWETSSPSAVLDVLWSQQEFVSHQPKVDSFPHLL